MDFILDTKRISLDGNGQTLYRMTYATSDAALVRKPEMGFQLQAEENLLTDEENPHGFPDSACSPIH
ncbi:MAG: hypothetical protein WBN03_07455 [Desulfobacterales bacterium]